MCTQSKHAAHMPIVSLCVCFCVGLCVLGSLCVGCCWRCGCWCWCFYCSGCCGCCCCGGCALLCVCHSKQVGSNIAILSFCCYYCYSSLLLVILFYYYSCFIMQYARSRFLSLELYRNRLELWCLRFSAINLRFYAIELRFEAQNALLGPNTRF